MPCVNELERTMWQFVFVNNKLMSGFNASVLLLTTNFVITLSRKWSCQSLSRFLQHDTARSISTPPGRMLVHRKSLYRNLLGFPNNSPVPIYTPGWREALWEWSVLPKNTTQCPRPGLEPTPLAPSALTARPLRLPQWQCYDEIRDQ